MTLPFNEMPANSRIWIYQSDRKLNDSELDQIKLKLTDFLKNWTAHGDDLKSSFEIRYDRFIIIALNEKSAKASGCSIDASVRFVQKLENVISADLMNKLNVSFKEEQSINIVSLSVFQNFVKAGKITSETIVFNNMVQTKGELALKWEVSARNSWHARFLN